MALIAEDAADRAGQLILLTERLTILISAETARIEARAPPLDAETDEKNRLANAYRLELARIKQDRSLLAGAPPALLAELRAKTEVLNTALAGHDIALGAVKLIAEGLVHAMAEEIARQRGGARGYGASGELDGSGGAASAVLDRSA